MEFELILPVIAGLAGVLIGGGGVAAVLGRANQSKDLKDSTEKLLADSVPQAALQTINQGVAMAQEALKFVAAVTDGLPNPPEDNSPVG